MVNRLSILGIRGIPAKHGGFETFAEKLALYLVARGWKVTVYCQEAHDGPVGETDWQGVRLVHVPIRVKGAAGTILFDWRSIIMSLSGGDTILTLGYNTALFNVMYRLWGRKNIINMDGIEWKRQKWGVLAKIWFRLNERIACSLGNWLIADHPSIAEHLFSHGTSGKTTVIPYGADEITSADVSLLSEFGLKPGAYSIVIARPEPENSVLEIVRAFSQKNRAHTLVVLGSFDVDKNSYHREVVESGSAEVMFVGAIYDKEVVAALRYYCGFYLHGHQVGGTNPSLVEALGAGCAVIAHDNRFNRWVAGDGAVYFKEEEECGKIFDSLLDSEKLLATMKAASVARFRQSFTWPTILSSYENVLSRW